MQLLLAPFAAFPVSFVAWMVSLGIATVMILVLFRGALTAERRARWVKAITNANARYLFSFLWVAWLLFFGILLFIVPHEGAGTPYGAHRPDRPVHGQLPAVRLPLGGHRGVAPPDLGVDRTGTIALSSADLQTA